MNLQVTGVDLVQWFFHGEKVIVKDVQAGETIDVIATFDWRLTDFITDDWALHIYSDFPVDFRNEDGEVSATNVFAQNLWA